MDIVEASGVENLSADEAVLAYDATLGDWLLQATEAFSTPFHFQVPVKREVFPSTANSSCMTLNPLHRYYN